MKSAPDDRVTRPEPERTAPNRAPPGAMPETPLDRSAATDVSGVIADAVRAGYEVIGDNLKQGRAAADRYSAGAYHLANATDDVAQLGRRLITLSRELSTTGFDLIGAVLRDPALREAVQRTAVPDPTPGPHPAPGGPVPVTCVLRGRPATARPAQLSQPDLPSMLVTDGLRAIDPAVPPITRISFSAPVVGRGVIATILIPDDQPPGVYNAVIADAVSHQPLGTLTVDVS